MKTVLTTLSLILSSILIQAQSDQLSMSDTNGDEGISITVTVPVQSDQGTVIMGLFDESNFMIGAPLKASDSEIVDGKAVGTFNNVQPGIYAISLFHDKNGNKQMDFEANGMPLEMYGLSNNPMSYGPPKWGDAKFEVGNESLEMEIRM